MKLPALIAISIVLAIVAPLQAASLTGQVVSVDPGNGQMTVIPSGTNATVSVQTGGNLPPFVQPGASVNIQGGYTNNRSVFRARRIGPAAPSEQPRDPTGVRSRLNRFKRNW